MGGSPHSSWGWAVGCYNSKSHCPGSSSADGRWVRGRVLKHGYGPGEGRSIAKGGRDAHTTFHPTTGQVGQKVLLPPVPLSPNAFQAEKARSKHVMDRRMKKWGWLMLGVLADMREPHPSPLPIPWMRDPSKGKRTAPPAPPAPPATPAEAPWGESDAAFAHQLQQDEQSA